ncbi:MAG: prolyl-tRNA synthetase [Parcubacteria group bacterium]|nr:prolyl-tRNA synthetase [Parcubacteria group bacterium]
MYQSTLFSKTKKETPPDEVSLNAQLLLQAGYVDKLVAGVYSYLPLGLKVLNNIQEIVRAEMNKIGGQEILMPALSPKANWQKTGRWEGFDVLFKLKGSGDKEYALGASHEEVVTPLVDKYVNSYRDLPVSLYQIQTKFRDEPRPKSGLLRGREFSMKDLYSFHRDQADLDKYYEKFIAAYKNIFSRCGLDAKLVKSGGGTFSKFSDEFQVFTPHGEDIVFSCSKCDLHQNKEIFAGDKCPNCQGKLEENKAIEVGNIFKLGSKYAKDFGLTYTDEKGQEQDVVMGCYGIGISRLMGAIVEVHHDEAGIIWPASITPFKVHLIPIGADKNDEVKSETDKLYKALQAKNIGVLYDDRLDMGVGQKLADADLLGMPVRLIISAKTLENGGCEVKRRDSDKVEIMPFDKLVEHLEK